ncbi:MAG: putative rane protein [Acidobacteriaceae bacterium]|nr:putative rane protein [Acidobacteriaceae bacterium]
MEKQKSAVLGILAGMTGGLAAAWVMNVFMAGPGQTLQQSVQSDEENREQQAHSGEPKEDATMKAADAIAHTVTGEHLSWAEKEKGGPIVHYAFAALAGGLYGGLAEYSSTVRSGFGTSFGGVLFSTADVMAVPAFDLGPSAADKPASALASPFAAHIVYGVTTELVRRIVRALF